MDKFSAEKSESVEERQEQRRWILRIALVIAFFVVILFLWWLFRKPSYGTILVAEPILEKVNLADADHRKQYTGKYITFTYPYDFTRREEQEVVKYPLLERVYLSRSDIEGRKIAITVQDNTGYRFDEYSSLRVRRLDSGTYSEEEIERNGLNTAFFTKNSVVFEVSVFFSLGNQVVSIVVSSPTTLDGLREEVLALLESFRWQEK